MGGGEAPLLLPPTKRGASCARTLLAALEDTQLRPEVIHIVGVGDAELSLDFDALSQGLPPGARVVLIGPHARRGAPCEELLGPVERSGLKVSVFPQTYQRYMVVCPKAEAPQFVALFHPGLDIHFFTWYPCLKYWTDGRIPTMVTAYKRPAGMGETPELVQTLLEALVGGGGGAGLWVIEIDNPYNMEEGSFNAGYFMLLGSQGELPTRADEMYFPVYQALRKKGYPFAPRVGYLDVSSDAPISASNASLLAAVAEGALRAAKAGKDGCDDGTARDFARSVLDSTIGPGAGEVWASSSWRRSACANCGEGHDDAAWHRSVCPAVGATELCAGDAVELAHLHRDEFNGRQGTLVRFNQEKTRWIVRMDDKEALFKAVNLVRRT